MAKKLDTKSRTLLNFRPNIDFIEPDQEEVVIEPQEVPVPVIDRVQKLKIIADAVGVLAAAVQAKVDKKAAGVRIKLDPIQDAAVIAAMRREFPDAFPEDDEAEDAAYITFDQYRECRDHFMDFADETAKKTDFDASEIAKARDALNAGATNIGGWGTPEAAEGGLRPELEPRARLVDPIDLAKFQNYLIRVLVNFIWKKFIRPLVSKIPGGGFLPKEIAKIPKSFKKQLKSIKDKGVQTL